MSKVTTNPDVIILCGGLGTRLRSVVADKPKVLADVAGKPFLDYQIEKLKDLGFSRIVLAVGHLKEQVIERYCGDPAIYFSEEDVPLGTGGAVRKAAAAACSDHVLVMNGDSVVDFSFPHFWDFHQRTGAKISILASRARDRKDAGNLECDQRGRVVSFREKAVAVGNDPLISAGVYLIQKSAVSDFPRTSPLSIEYDVFPAFVAGLSCFAYSIEGSVLDIGTPERYRMAQDIYTPEEVRNSE